VGTSALCTRGDRDSVPEIGATLDRLGESRPDTELHVAVRAQHAAARRARRRLQDIVRLEASGALGEPDRGSRDSEFETTDAVDPTAVLADPVQEPVDELTCQKITPAREAILRMVIP